MFSKVENYINIQRHENIGEVIEEYADKYRKSKKKGIPIKKPAMQDEEKKDIDGAFEAFIATIKLDSTKYRKYKKFIKLIIDNKHVYEQEFIKLKVIEDRIKISKLSIIKYRFYILMSIRLVKRLLNIVESYEENKFDNTPIKETFTATALGFNDEDDSEGWENSEFLKTDKNKATMEAPNLQYWYTDEDVDLCIRARLIERKYQYCEGKDFILKDKFPLLGKLKDSKCVVAILPSVSTSSNIPIHYYIDSEVGPEWLMAHYLEEIVKDNNFLKEAESSTGSNLIKLISDKIEDRNEETLNYLSKTLLNCKFQLKSIKDEIANYKTIKITKRIDVLDEIMPILNKNESEAARILFPLNTGVHWCTVEIEITKGINSFKANITLHNPYGAGILNSKDFNFLRSSITKKILSYSIFDEVDINITNNKSIFNGSRQDRNESVSCGVITVEDIIKRINDIDLDEENYQIGAEKIRQAQRKCVDEKIRGINIHACEDFLGRTGLKKSTTVAILEKNSKKYLKRDTYQKKLNLRIVNNKSYDESIVDFFGHNYSEILDMLVAQSSVKSYREMLKYEILNRLDFIVNLLLESVDAKTLGKNEKDILVSLRKYLIGLKLTSNDINNINEILEMCSTEFVYKWYIDLLKSNIHKNEGKKLGYDGIKLVSKILEINLLAFVEKSGVYSYSDEHACRNRLSNREIYILVQGDYGFIPLTRQFSVSSVNDVVNEFEKSYFRVLDISKSRLQDMLSPSYENYNYMGYKFENILKEVHDYFIINYRKYWGFIIDKNSAERANNSYMPNDKNEAARVLQLLQAKHDELDDAMGYCIDQEQETEKEYHNEVKKIEDTRNNYYNKKFVKLCSGNKVDEFPLIPKSVVRLIMNNVGEQVNWNISSDSKSAIVSKLKTWIGVLPPSYINELTKTNLICYASEYRNDRARRLLLESGVAKPFEMDHHQISSNDYYSILNKDDKRELVDNILLNGMSVDIRYFFAYHALRDLEKDIKTYLESLYQEEYQYFIAERGRSIWNTLFGTKIENIQKRKTETNQVLEIVLEAQNNFLVDFFDNLQQLISRGKKLSSPLHNIIKNKCSLFLREDKYGYVIKPASLILEDYRLTKQELAQLRDMRLAPICILDESSNDVTEKNKHIEILDTENKNLLKKMDDSKSMLENYRIELEKAHEQNMLLKAECERIEDTNKVLENKVENALIQQEKQNDEIEALRNQIDALLSIIQRGKQNNISNSNVEDLQENNEANLRRSSAFFQQRP